MDSIGDDGQVTEHHLTKEEVREHAGPWLIAVGVAVKSFLALMIAFGLEMWGAQRMHGWIGVEIVRHHLNPERGFFATMMRWTSHGTVHPVTALLIAYASVHGVEAWGLWRDKPWASWLGCVGSALYLPVDGYALWREPGWIAASLVVINIFVVLVLGWNIRRLRNRDFLDGH